MEIHFNCPHCFNKLKAESEYCEQEVICPHCNNTIIVPPLNTNEQEQENMINILSQDTNNQGSFYREINFNCPHCLKKLKAESEYCEQEVICPHCNNTIIVPPLNTNEQEQENMINIPIPALNTNNQEQENINLDKRRKLFIKIVLIAFGVLNVILLAGSVILFIKSSSNNSISQTENSNITLEGKEKPEDPYLSGKPRFKEKPDKPEDPYLSGKRCFEEKKYEEAVKYFRKAAERGHADAQYQLGMCYEFGFGVEKDLSEAVKWFRKAAERGHADAQYQLGMCYDCGRGVKKDLNEAVKWFRKAAAQGNVDAQWCVGLYDLMRKDQL